MEFKEGPDLPKRKADSGRGAAEAISSVKALEYRGERFTGKNHAEAILALTKTHPDCVWREVRQGFITTRGRFVERDEADEIAERNDQVQGRILD